MKKLVALTILSVLVLSCGTPKTVQESRKVLKGYWSLDNITYSEKGTFNVKLLNDTSKECFEGTTWRFIPNNHTGIYTVDNPNCPSGDRNFIFDIQEMNPESGLYDFLLKPTDEKENRKTMWASVCDWLNLPTIPCDGSKPFPWMENHLP